MVEYREYVTFRGSQADPWLEMLKRDGPCTLLDALAHAEYLSDYIVADGEPWSDRDSLCYVEDTSLDLNERAEWVIAADWICRRLTIAWQCEEPL